MGQTKEDILKRVWSGMGLKTTGILAVVGSKPGGGRITPKVIGFDIPAGADLEVSANYSSGGKIAIH